MGLALRQMLTCGLRGGFARLYLEAKVIEIIAMRLSQASDRESEPGRVALNSRDVVLLEEARHILLKRCNEPPTISELARLVGLNRTKLKAGFRMLFGTTVFGLLKSHRMQLALELMLESICNVTEAAQTVGYNSPGAFAEAFKAEFGFPPRLARALKPSEYRTPARPLPQQPRPLAQKYVLSRKRQLTIGSISIADRKSGQRRLMRPEMTRPPPSAADAIGSFRGPAERAQRAPTAPGRLCIGGE